MANRNFVDFSAGESTLPVAPTTSPGNTVLLPQTEVHCGKRVVEYQTSVMYECVMTCVERIAVSCSEVNPVTLLTTF